MFNKMSSPAKYLNVKQSLLKIKCFQNEIKEFEEEFKSDYYTIKVGEHSYINFSKEKNYEDLLVLEQGFKCIYKNMEKISKKRLRGFIDQLTTCFELFTIRLILLFMIKEPLAILSKSNTIFFIFFFSKKRLELVLFMQLKNSKTII